MFIAEIGRGYKTMKHINKTRLCSLAVAAIVTVSCVALTGCGGKKDSAAASPAASTSTAASAENAGTCGEGVTWALADGTLTVGGTGRMTNFTSDNQAPWADQADQITAVKVEGTVTSIGAVAFKDCTNLTTVTIEDGVEYIEAGAFNGCSALTDITIPESVGYIKTGAFKDCSALTSVTIRENCRLDLKVFPETVEVNHF